MKNFLPLVLAVFAVGLVPRSAQADFLTWNGGATQGMNTRLWSASANGGWFRGGMVPASWSQQTILPGNPVAIFDASVNSIGPVQVSGIVDVFEIRANEGAFEFLEGTLNLAPKQPTANPAAITVDGTRGASLTIRSNLTGSNGLYLGNQNAYPYTIYEHAVTFSGDGQYTGDTYISGLPVKYEYWDSATKLDANSQLHLTKASVTFESGQDAVVESVSGLVLDGVGVSKIAVNTTDGDFLLQLGNVSRANGSVLFLNKSPFGSGVATVESNLTNTNGMVGAYVVLSEYGSGQTWASSGVGGNLEAAALVADQFNPNANVDLTQGASLNESTAIHSLRISGDNVTLDLGASELSLDSGGLLVTGTQAVLQGGSLATANPELFIYNFSASELVVASAITGATTQVIVAGTEAVRFSGGNSFGGGLKLLDTNLTIGSDSSIGGVVDIVGDVQLTLENSVTVTGLNIAAPFGSVWIESEKTLTINQSSGSNTVFGSVGGDGLVVKTGEGSWQVASTGSVGNLLIAGGSVQSSVSGLGGATEIAGGRLIVNSEGGEASTPITLNSGRLFVGFGTTLTGVDWNGGVIEGTGIVTGELVVDTGKALSPGNSPGTASFEAQTWGSGGTYIWEINDANGLAGTDPGWDLIDINLGSPGSQTLTIAATPADRFVLSLQSLNLGNEPGAVTGWDNTVAYGWMIARTTDGILGFDPAKFQIETTSFAAYNNLGGGNFYLTLEESDRELWLRFNPIPEPSGMMLALAALVGATVLRRRRL